MSKHILLIGSSQQGKSTLANFLLYGEVSPDRDLAFEVGDGNESTTKVPLAKEYVHTRHQLEGDEKEIAKVIDEYEKETKGMDPQARAQKLLQMPENAKKRYPNLKVVEKAESIKIVDTPGVGDVNQDQEAINMLALYKVLATPGFEISSALLVVKYPTLISDEFKGNIKFYKDVFPQVFDKNVMVIVTDWTTTKLEEMARLRQDPATVLQNILNKTAAALELPREALVAASINSIAGPDYMPADFEKATKLREEIFNRCVALPSLKIQSLKFPKPKTWREADDIKASMLQAERTGITTGLKLANSLLKEAAHAADQAQRSLVEERQKEAALVEELAEKDSSDQLVIFDKLYQASGGWIWDDCQFNIQTDDPIREVCCSFGWIVFDYKDTYEIRGKIVAGWFDRTFSSSLTAYTTKRDRFGKDLPDIKARLELTRSRISDHEKALAAALASGTTPKAQLEQLTIKDAKIAQEIQMLVSKKLSVAEISARINAEEKKK